jgi:hypothetical protein
MEQKWQTRKLFANRLFPPGFGQVLRQSILVEEAKEG